MTKSLFRGGKARLFGHPIHPMLVHFPTALFAVSFGFDLAGMVLGNPEFHHLSFYLVGTGLAGGVLAGVFGMVDLTGIKQGEIMETAIWHAGLQILVLTAFGVLFGLRLRQYPDLGSPGYGMIIMAGSAVLIMLAGNYLGGELVFRHGVGIKRDEEG